MTIIHPSNRLDAGKFEQVSKPYNFHTVLQSLLAPVRLAAESKGLELQVDLDPDIERVRRETFGSA
jgi:osomolarity two-component system, sensor histidine kinase SLN1